MSKEKIVVIDDSPIVRKLAELALQEEGYKVYTAEDGEEGLKIAEDVRPAVILVDFIMPRMSGYQFCKAARENELLKDIPLILITGKGEDVGKKFAEKFGVVDYFIKPFKSEMLVEKVNAIVLSRRQQREELAEEFDVTPAVDMAAGMPAFAESSFAPEIPAFPELPPVPDMPAMPEVPVFDTPPFAELEAYTTPPTDEVTAEPETYAAPPDDQLTPEREAYATPPTDYSFEPSAEPESSFEAPIETLHAEESFASFSPSFSETTDFTVMPEFAPTASVPEPMIPLIAPVAASPACVTDDAAVERVMQRYFAADLPFLIEKTLEDLLKQHGLIKPSNIILSGSLGGVQATDVLALIDMSGMTGVFSVFSAAGSAEIYFDNGTVVHALTSRGKTLASGKLAQYQATISGGRTNTQELDAEALAMVAGLTEGTYFFERLAVPESLLMDASGERPLALVLRALRSAPPPASPGSATVLAPAANLAAAESLGLTDDEKILFTLVDGKRTIADIAGQSGLGSEAAGVALDRLTRAGVLRHKGGF